MNIENLVDYIVEKYKCHSIILYGSFAKGDHDDESDIDVIGFTNDDIEIQDKSFFEGRSLDLWIFNDKKMDVPDEFIHIHLGHVLLDKTGKAKDMLAKINVVFQKGPEPKTFDSKLNSIRWLEKMFLRTLKYDIEGQYRLHWLLTDILPIYFEIIDRWYLGSKESFVWLEEFDHEAFDLFKGLYSKPTANNLKETLLFMKRKLEHYN